jgi:glycosyltransferase involved in cell wall biosynthesis
VPEVLPEARTANPREATAGDTPRSWRIAAAAVLAGALLLGDRSSSGGRARLTVLGVLGVLLAGGLPIPRASRRPPIPPRAAPLDPKASDPTFSVLIAARDEASVMPRLIRDLADQDHRDRGIPLFEVIVIDDRSVDGTAQAALQAATDAGIGDVVRIIRRSGEGIPDGKGAALAAVQPDRCTGDVIVVLDADARVGPGFLSAMARYILAGADAVTARRRILDADESWLAGAQADEQTLDGVIQRGRWAMGGCSEFRGNGIVVRRDLLAAVGGWSAEALTEDVDLSSRIAAAHGTRVAWAIDAEVWEEPVRSWSALWRQRVRWSEGGARRILRHGPAVLRSHRLSRFARADFVAYVGQLVAAPFITGVLLGAVRRRRWGIAGGLIAAYAAVGGGLAYDALRWEHQPDGTPLRWTERLRRAGRVAVFNAFWLGTVPAALWRLATHRGPIVYDKMEHGSRE